MVPKITNPTFWRATSGPNNSDSRHSFFSPTPALITACIFLVWLFLITTVLAADPLDSKAVENVIRNPKLPWQLEADSVEYDQKTDEYAASGNVLIYKGNIKLLADYVRFDRKNMKAHAQGNVILTNGEDVLSGTSMDMDLQNQIGSVVDGYLYLKQNNYHITGDVIKKVGTKTYTIDEATMTTCDGPKPDWKITGKKVKIKEDGEGTARHVKM
jgi:LPS-assembly protein